MRWWWKRGSCSGLVWARLVTAAALAALWRGWRPRLEASLAAHAPPPAAAHALADFGNHVSLYPHIKSWRIQEETSNYTWWRYGVRFDCGRGCAGAARVTHATRLPAAAPAAPAAARPAAPAAARPARHAVPDKHLLFFSHSYCVGLPLLEWPQFCDEVLTEVEISSGGGEVGRDGGGQSLLRVNARGNCWLGGSGACASLNSLPDAMRTLLKNIIV